ncbi:chromosome segregation ATPase [Paraburkholderia sp. GAS448]|uniref:DNA-binding protein n=1 Tax=Paraburkholderia sp. GAS448 TaxID=3035136 RepID=UPI003D20F417
MSDAIPDETRLLAEIERLKAGFPKTRDLYREACALLFFRFGVTPTANRLYQLVRRGSMSTPVAVLQEFWAELREKSRVRIEHADLPEELQAATGELAAVLWTRAVGMAQESLAALRHESQLAVADAQARQAQAEAEVGRLRQELTGSATALDDARRHVSGLEQALAGATATCATLQDQLRDAQQGEQRLQQALESARNDFAAELDKLRADGQLAQERLRAAETRALLDIDRERGVAARLQKERDAAEQRAGHSEARLHADVQVLQTQLGDARQQIGVLEGSLDTVRRANAGYVEELKALRQQGLASMPGGTAGRGGRRKGEAMAGAARRLARSAGKATMRKKAT